MMDTILNKLRVYRGKAAGFCSRYEAYIVPVVKFFLALILFTLINTRFGFMSKIAKFPLAFIMALACSFLPMNMIILLAALVTLLHAYALSMPCALVLAVIYVIMFLLYFKFSPKDALAVILTPICLFLKIPYVIPMSFGLVGTPGSAVSVGCGVIVYYVLKYLKEVGEAFKEAEISDIVTILKTILEGLLANKEMIVCAVAFAATVLVVYVVRRLSINHAWTIAMGTGALTNILIILVGDILYRTNISIVGLIFGTILACVVVMIIQFCAFDLDYSKTEKVQFEDEDYYYYVKAVPKIKTQEEKELAKSRKEAQRRSAGKSERSSEERIAQQQRRKTAISEAIDSSEDAKEEAVKVNNVRRSEAAPSRNDEARRAEIARRREARRKAEEAARAKQATLNEEPTRVIEQTEDDDLGMSRRLAYQKRKMEEKNTIE